MKQQTVNEFRDGLNLDLHPLVTPKTVLTDNINGTFITYNGNELCLQNDRGNKQVAQLTQGYTPIGIKEHNGILYIVSVNEDKTEIGTYPSPNYDLYNIIEADYTNGEFDEDKYNDRVFEQWYSNSSLEYQPLHVLGNRAALTNQNLGYTINTPVTIEIQDSYDGSVNLILVADKKVPRIINSGFSVNGDKYKFVNRNQSKDTNVYDNLKYESELIRTNDQLTNIKLLGVQSGGQWKGGNYTFYIKFGDSDYNQTDVVAESGIVSIFKGNDCVPSTISGTLLDERTDKMIHLEITGLNPIYSKMYIYFTREYSDTQGFRMTESGMLTEPIDVNIQERYYYNQYMGGPFVEYYQQIWLTGFEQTSSIESELLNIDYHTVDWARAETQHSNMLFLGNVGQKETFDLYKKLDQFTKDFNVVVKQDLEQNEGLLKVSNDYSAGEEYYSTTNIYSKLGYWPDEIYRFGIVYILRDGSTTPVFNVSGGVFTELNTPVENNEYANTDGVFLTPKVDIISNSDTVRPLYFRFTLPNDVSLLEQNGVIGWFVVRQKRIPRTICQGLSIGIDEKSHLPMIWNGNDWMIESFLSLDRIDKDKQLELIDEIKQLEEDKKYTWLRVLGVLSALPIFGIFVNGFILANAVTYGVSKTLSAKTKLEQLKDSLNEDKKPLLQYFAGSLKEFETDTYGLRFGSLDSSLGNGQNILLDQYYHAKYDTYEDWQAGYIQEPKVIANKAYLVDLVEDVSSTIYEYQYLLVEPETFNIHTEPYQSTYLYIISNDPDYLSDITIERDEKNKRIVLVTNESDVTTLLSETVNLQLNETTLNWIRNENALIRSYAQYRDRYILESVASLKGRGILSLDPCVNSTVSGMLDGSIFKIQEEYSVNCAFGPRKDQNDLYFNDNYLKVDHANYRYIAPTTSSQNLKCVYVAPNTNIKVVDNYGFSNVAGTAYEVSKFKHTTESFYKEINSGVLTYMTKSNEENNDLNLIRGKFTPYVGVASNNLNDSRIYSIRLNETTNLNNLLLVRQQDNSEYYCVSNRNSIVLDNNENTNAFNVYRGDCYTNTVTMRIINNFIDPTAPVSEQIVDPEGWYKMLIELDKQNSGGGSGSNSGNSDAGVWSEVNLSDVNTVDLAFWVTFKCLSSYNLGLRSIDSFHTDEMSMFGSPRSFYPLNGMSTATGNKMEDSYLLNDGLSATVGRKRYNLMPDVPYSKSEFSNRIMFSNVNITDAFTNGYRTFQGLSYKDYDKQYGAITKLIPLGQNIFIVMEHGLGLVPVNPKALMQTTTGEMIHIYGYGVLPDEMTIISQDYGSKYEHSVIRTPIGIYGVDVDAKKIWRFSDKQGFETISDMKIETYLKDNLIPLQIQMGLKDIRTHYNAKKGDLMFTWDDKNSNSLYSICYNERQNIWTTKYDWKPVVSENINDSFYSLNTNSIWHHSDDVGYNDTHVSQWYGQNKKFEFEFVVSDPVGVNKIFDNLQIISNNVQPDEMEITVIGDDYVFKRTPVNLTSGHKEHSEYENVSDIHTTSNIHGDLESTQLETEHSPKGYYHFDKRLNQSALTKWQPFKDMYKFGRRVGNIQYKEGSWFAQIEPILVTDERLVAKESRIRDKWAKIRIRYSGKNLAVITAIKTLINI